MRLLHFSILIYSFMGISSCGNGKVTDKDVDTFISKYNAESFTHFKCVSISFRDKDFNENIYMVAKQGGNFPCYVVRYNKSKNEVTNIDDKLLKQVNLPGYFSDSQIKDLMNNFINYDVQHLSVDSNENVFISPFFGENSPALLRLKVTTNESEVKKGTIYKLYRDNWYISK